MRGFARVFAFEVKDKRALFLAALFAGLLVFPLAWGVRAGSGFGFAEARDAAAFTLAVAWGLGLAAILGATVLGRDLGENRLGFYLSRPVSELGLWAGKMAAALVLTLAACFITLLPATLAGGGLFRLAPIDNPFFLWDWGGDTLSPWLTALVCLVVVALVLAAAHALSVMVRSRSPLILLDALLAGAFAAALAALYRGFSFWQAYPLLFLLLPALLLLLLIALPLAGAVQMASGRSDLKRGHKLLSLTLWPILFGGLGAAGLFTSWYVHVAPSDLKAVTVATAAPDGPWVSIAGVAKHRGPYAQPGFLLNTQTGNWTLVTWDPWGSSQPVFSPDGKTAVWMEWRRASGATHPELVAADLTGGDLKLLHPEIALPSRWGVRFFFSPDSTKLALLSQTELTLITLPGFEQVASVRLPSPPSNSDASWNGRFQGEKRILLYQRIYPGRMKSDGSEAMNLCAFDTVARKLETTGSVGPTMASLFWVSPDGDRLLTRTKEAGKVGVTLRDGRTGEVLRQIAEGLEWGMPAFLPDGRIVVVERVGQGTSVRVLSPGGDEERAYPIGEDMYALFQGEPVAGALLFATKPIEDKGWHRASCCLLHLDTGKVESLEGLRPASLVWWFDNFLFGRYPQAGQGGLFLDAKGGLVRYDFATGERKTIVKGRG